MSLQPVAVPVSGVPTPPPAVYAQPYATFQYFEETRGVAQLVAAAIVKAVTKFAQSNPSQVGKGVVAREILPQVDIFLSTTPGVTSQLTDIVWHWNISTAATSFTAPQTLYSAIVPQNKAYAIFGYRWLQPSPVVSGLMLMIGTQTAPWAQVLVDYYNGFLLFPDPISLAPNTNFTIYYVAPSTGTDQFAILGIVAEAVGTTVSYTPTS